MSRPTGYVPYETLAETEADEIFYHQGAGNVRLHPDDAWKYLHFLAIAYSRGLEAGFDMSEFEGNSPVDGIAIFNAGIAEGFERGDETGHQRGYQQALDDIRKLGGEQI